MSLNRLTSASTGPPGNIATYSYAGPGLVQSRTYGNGVQLSLKHPAWWGYDGAKRVMRFRYAHGSTTLAEFEYGYDRDSLRLYEKRLHETPTNGNFPGQQYVYTNQDGRSAHRLESFRDGLLNSSNVIVVNEPKRQEDRTYDVEGNWAGLAVTGAGPDNWSGSNPQITSGHGSGMNQYATFRGSNWTYAFTGALTNDGTRSFKYDQLDRLIEMTDTTSGAITRYAYDAENRRFQKTTNASSPSPTTREYVYDGWRVIEEDATADGTAEQRYIWANVSDRLLSVEQLEPTGWKRYFVHNDALGSTRVVTDANGTVVATFRYGAFGETLEATGSQSGCTVVTCLMPFRYTGQQFDPEGGLYYYKNRTYHPSAGRFLTRDPAGYVDGVNLYAYVRNAPSAAVDPLGLFSYSSRPPPNAQGGMSYQYSYSSGSPTNGWYFGRSASSAPSNEASQTSPESQTGGGDGVASGAPGAAAETTKPRQGATAPGVDPGHPPEPACDYSRNVPKNVRTKVDPESGLSTSLAEQAVCLAFKHLSTAPPGITVIDQVRDLGRRLPAITVVTGDKPTRTTHFGIEWNPLNGLSVAAGIQSPAMGLYQELIHWTQAYGDEPATQISNDIASWLGEPLRERYGDGGWRGVVVYGPLSRERVNETWSFPGYWSRGQP